jgi:hypothetical protein
VERDLLSADEVLAAWQVLWDGECDSRRSGGREGERVRRSLVNGCVLEDLEPDSAGTGRRGVCGRGSLGHVHVDRALVVYRTVRSERQRRAGSDLRRRGGRSRGAVVKLVCAACEREAHDMAPDCVQHRIAWSVTLVTGPLLRSFVRAGQTKGRDHDTPVVVGGLTNVLERLRDSAVDGELGDGVVRRNKRGCRNEGSEEGLHLDCPVGQSDRWGLSTAVLSLMSLSTVRGYSRIDALEAPYSTRISQSLKHWQIGSPREPYAVEK